MDACRFPFRLVVTDILCENDVHNTPYLLATLSGTLTFIYIYLAEHLRATQKNIGASEGRFFSRTRCTWEKKYVFQYARNSSREISSNNTKERVGGQSCVTHATCLPRFTIQSFSRIYRRNVSRTIRVFSRLIIGALFRIINPRKSWNVLDVMNPRRIRVKVQQPFVLRAAQKKCSNWIYRERPVKYLAVHVTIVPCFSSLPPSATVFVI